MSTAPDTDFAKGDHFGCRQAFVVIALGLLFWFAGVLVIRFGAPAGLFSSTAAPWLFLLSLPGAALTVWVVQRVAGLSRAQLLPALGLGTAVAMHCDGIALTWFPALYGGEDLHRAGAWLLWAAAGGITLAWLAGRRRSG